MRRHVLEDDPVDAEAHGLDGGVLTDLGSEKDDTRRSGMAVHRAQHAEAVEVGHANVEYDDVGAMFPNGRQPLSPRPASRDDLEVGLGAEERLQALDDDGMVVDEHDADPWW